MLHFLFFLHFLFLLEKKKTKIWGKSCSIRTAVIEYMTSSFVLFWYFFRQIASFVIWQYVVVWASRTKKVIRASLEKIRKQIETNLKTLNKDRNFNNSVQNIITFYTLMSRRKRPYNFVQKWYWLFTTSWTESKSLLKPTSWLFSHALLSFVYLLLL